MLAGKGSASAVHAAQKSLEMLMMRIVTKTDDTEGQKITNPVGSWTPSNSWNKSAAEFHCFPHLFRGKWQRCCESSCRVVWFWPDQYYGFNSLPAPSSSSAPEECRRIFLMVICLLCDGWRWSSAPGPTLTLSWSWQGKVSGAYQNTGLHDGFNIYLPSVLMDCGQCRHYSSVHSGFY